MKNLCVRHRLASGLSAKAMNLINESWLIEIGHDVIEKKTHVGLQALNKTEKAIYCLWVIDYAVRNSGSLAPIEDLHPGALKELEDYADAYGWKAVSSMLRLSADEETFFSKYLDRFDSACGEIRAQYEKVEKWE